MTDATELDEAAVRARAEACLRGFEAEVPAHWYGQTDVVARALRKEYGPGGIYDADAAFITTCSPSVVLAALDEITRLRAALDEASSHECATCSDCLHDGAKCCGCYDGTCCKRLVRVTQDAEEWTAVAADAERRVGLMAARAEAAESAVVAGRALADEWEQEGGKDSTAWRVFGPQVLSVPFAVEQVRAALATPTTSERSD